MWITVLNSRRKKTSCNSFIIAAVATIKLYMKKGSKHFSRISGGFWTILFFSSVATATVEYGQPQKQQKNTPAVLSIIRKLCVAVATPVSGHLLDPLMPIFICFYLCFGIHNACSIFLHVFVCNAHFVQSSVASIQEAASI